MAQEEETQHALLIAWGRFAQEIGLIAAIETVELKQKVYEHTPQTKVLEFFVAILSGLKQLQEISLAAHPLDKDAAVAKAWDQTAWAEYTGVSRALKSLSWDEVHMLVAALEKVGQPFLAQELSLMKCVQYDGDLTGLPVSNTSKTYPNAAFGHMSDEIRLGLPGGCSQLGKPNIRSVMGISGTSCWRYRFKWSGKKPCFGGRKTDGSATPAAHRIAGKAYRGFCQKSRIIRETA